MKKVLLAAIAMMFFASSFCLAEDAVTEEAVTEQNTTTTVATTSTEDPVVEQNTTTTVAATTTEPVKAAPTSLPFAFRFNKFLLNIRKAITTDPVEKLNIDGEILAREAKIISEYQEKGRVNEQSQLVRSYMQRKENLAKRIDLIEEKDARVDALIERVVSNPVISDENEEKILEILSSRQERLGAQNEFLQEKTKLLEERKAMVEKAKEERKEIIETTKEDRKEIVDQMKALPKITPENKDQVLQERKDLLEQMKDVKDAGLQKMQDLREQGKEAIEKRKQEFQNMQKPATPIRNMQQAMEGVNTQVAQ